MGEFTVPCDPALALPQGEIGLPACQKPIGRPRPGAGAALKVGQRTVDRLAAARPILASKVEGPWRCLAPGQWIRGQTNADSGHSNGVTSSAHRLQLTVTAQGLDLAQGESGRALPVRSMNVQFSMAGPVAPLQQIAVLVPGHGFAVMAEIEQGAFILDGQPARRGVFIVGGQ